jgi:hypothetical protein
VKVDGNIEIKWLLQWISVIVALLCAAWVAATGHDGWGWFLFLAFLLALST